MLTTLWARILPFSSKRRVSIRTGVALGTRGPSARTSSWMARARTRPMGVVSDSMRETSPSQ